MALGCQNCDNFHIRVTAMLQTLTLGGTVFIWR